MPELRLTSLKLRNFKGCRSFELAAGGSDVDIYGDNATGKTTIMDAWLWLLFDKDSENRKDFGVKTLTESGEAHHGLEHEVEGVLELDGSKVTLRKIFTEKWTKKRGSATKLFEGHTTDYEIDGVPVKKGEYTARVAEFCDESAFRLLTDPGYFNQVMKWQDRRQLLLEVCGDISDADVIASDEQLARLPEILENRSLEDHRKVIAAKRKAINDELDKIPVRIDEVTQAMPADVGRRQDIEAELLKGRTEVQEKHQERARIEAGGQVAEKRRQLAELEAELLAIENDARRQAADLQQSSEGEARAIKGKIADLGSAIAAKQREIEANQATIERLDRQMDDLRAKFAEVDAEDFLYDPNEACPTCGQRLPTEQLEAVVRKAQAAFNAGKAHRLEQINAEGKQLKTQAGNTSLLSDQLRKAIDEASAEAEGLKQQLDALPAPAQTGAHQETTESPAYTAKVAEIEVLKAEIAQLAEGNTAALAAVDTEVAGLKETLSGLESDLASVEQHERGQERIEELKTQEKELSKEFERLEADLFLCESFIKAKVGLLEEKINAKFQQARFKLFDVQINEGVKECCETTFQGVPYSDLNNGARINIGLDIINTLSEHYGFVAPIFVDNAEAVTQLIDTRGQLIRLVVSEADKQLRVETKTATVLKEAVNG